MNKIRFYFQLVASCAIVLVALSCNDRQKQEYVQNAISFDTIQQVKTHFLNDDKNKPSCSVKLIYSYPTVWTGEVAPSQLYKELNYYFFNDTVYETMTPDQAATEYTNRYIQNFDSEAITNNFKEWQNPINSREYYSFYQILENKIIYNERNFISFETKTADQKANITTRTARYVTLNLDSGLFITEELIFIDEYRKPLSQLMKNALLKQYKQTTTDQLYKIGYFDIDDLSPNNNFWLNNEGITYVYNEGEIGANSLGETRILISYKDLTPILKKDNPISKLINETR